VKFKYLSTLFVVVILVAGIFYWQANYSKIDKTSVLHKVIGPVFIKYGLTDDKLVKKSVEENKLGSKKYVSVFVEYDAPKSFIWRDFDRSLRLAIRKSELSIYDVEQSFEKDAQCHTVIINFGRFDVLTFKINHRIKAMPPQAVEKVFNKPRIAIVVDDFGYSKNNIKVFLSLRQPITISILPEQRYSRDIADLARSRGLETILHLPLESDRTDVVEEADTIKSGMSEREILLTLAKEIACVPGVDGVNNHMGSKATANTAIMTTVLRYLKSRNLYFLDSMTTNKSVCMEAAKSLGVRCYKRDMFLDNSNNTAAIEKQLSDLKALAFKRGKAIAICHDRKNTAAVLSRLLPEMAQEGIEFVSLSDLEKA